MSKDDFRDILIGVAKDVGWIKQGFEEMKKENNSREKRIDSLENTRSKFVGGLKVTTIAVSVLISLSGIALAVIKLVGG